MITLVYLAVLLTISLNNGTSESLSNPSKLLNTISLRSSRNLSAISIVISGIKIVILGLKAMIGGTAG
jgi:hypothetical protein